MHKYLFIILLILLFVFSCTVNETTALIRLENTSAVEAKNIKIGNTTLIWSLSKGAVYDYWTCSAFEGVLSIEGIDSSYLSDVYIKILPQWEYSIFIYTNSDGDNVWSVTADKAGVGDEDISEVIEY